MSFKELNKLNADRPGYFKPKEGENRIRIVTDYASFTDAYNNDRFVMFIIDREDGQMKPFTFGPQIAGAIGALAASTEYGFDGLPPYDMVLTRKGSGIDTEYTVTGARTNSELTEDEKAKVEKLPDVAALALKLNEKAGTRVSEEDETPPPTDDDMQG